MSTAGYFQSSVGKKFIMAITGIILVGFILGHLVGNLQVFLGPEVFNKYAAFLHSLGGLLWIARIFLLVMLLAHIFSAISLTKENMSARPIKYHHEETNVASLSSRIMIHSGFVIAIFIVLHLLHFTAVVYDQQLQSCKNTFNIYNMVVFGFQNKIASTFYIVSMGLLSYHLNHAIFSIFQTLGINNTNLDKKLKAFSTLLSILIFLGYSSIPTFILLNVVKPQGGC